jgi:hypothetical protein
MDHFWWAYERVNLDSKTRKLAKSLSEVGFLDEMLKDKYFNIDIHLITWSNGLSYVDLNRSVWRPIKNIKNNYLKSRFWLSDMQARIDYINR